MAYIYTITNKENGKQYVGKTEHSVPIERFKEHLKESCQERSKHRPLYRAMNKYGVSKFCFEVLEEVSTANSCEREIYWIKELNTYGSSGYNATKGGDGAIYLDHQNIIQDYLELQNATKVSLLHDCHLDSVINILKQNNIKILKGSEVTSLKLGKSVKMLDKDTLKVLEIFPSQMEAARYLINKGYSKAKRAEQLSSKIGAVCNGKRITTGGFKWERV